jgi:hypothetical protein
MTKKNNMQRCTASAHASICFVNKECEWSTSKSKCSLKQSVYDEWMLVLHKYVAGSEKDSHLEEEMSKIPFTKLGLDLIDMLTPPGHSITPNESSFLRLLVDDRALFHYCFSLWSSRMDIFDGIHTHLVEILTHVKQTFGNDSLHVKMRKIFHLAQIHIQTIEPEDILSPAQKCEIMDKILKALDNMTWLNQLYNEITDSLQFTESAIAGTKTILLGQNAKIMCTRINMSIVVKQVHQWVKEKDHNVKTLLNNVISIAHSKKDVEIIHTEDEIVHYKNTMQEILLQTLCTSLLYDDNMLLFALLHSHNKQKFDTYANVLSEKFIKLGQQERPSVDQYRMIRLLSRERWILYTLSHAKVSEFPERIKKLIHSVVEMWKDVNCIPLLSETMNDLNLSTEQIVDHYLSNIWTLLPLRCNIDIQTDERLTQMNLYYGYKAVYYMTDMYLYGGLPFKSNKTMTISLVDWISSTELSEKITFNVDRVRAIKQTVYYLLRNIDPDSLYQWIQSLFYFKNVLVCIDSNIENVSKIVAYREYYTSVLSSLFLVDTPLTSEQRILVSSISHISSTKYLQPVEVSMNEEKTIVTSVF